jgi:Mg-chelatase subunit ChlD
MIGDQGDVEAAFQRAAAEMRTGAPYVLTASLSVVPSAPGKLSVTLDSSKSGTHSAASESIALLLDASGSMLQKIKGRQKIDIARGELDHLVREVIPEATPVTLRVYGQGGRGSCRSDLMMPLAALDRQKAEAIVSTIRSTDGARTATAASLHAAAEDLAAAKGAKRVILITDGEENCKGNVEMEIAALHKQGFDVELDVVGFAIDSPAVGKTFARWAKLGGGQYVQSTDASTLDQALTRALRQSFEVVDDRAAIICTGVVGGEPVVLPAGRYTVRLRNQPTASTRVEIKPAVLTAAMLSQ